VSPVELHGGQVSSDVVDVRDDVAETDGT